MTLRSLTPWLIAITLAGFGCADDSSSDSDVDSSSSDGDHDSDHDADHDADADADGAGDHDHTTCGLLANCKDTVDLEDGLSITSDEGKFKITVLSHAPLSVDNNDMVLEIRDANDDLVDDAEVTQDVLSVDCMHGGPKPPQDISPDASGHYEVMPVNLHQGPWDTTLEITAGGVTDTAAFHFCIPEPPDAG